MSTAVRVAPTAAPIGLERLEALLVEKAAAAAHDDAGGNEFGTVRLGFGKADEARAVIAFRGDHFLDGCVARLRDGLKSRRADRGDDDRIGRLDGCEERPRINAANKGLRSLDGENVGDGRNVELRRHAGHGGLSDSGGDEKHVRVALGLVKHEAGEHFRRLLGELRMVGVIDGANARELSRLFGDGLAVAARHENVDDVRHLKRGRKRLRRRWLERHVVVFGNQKSCHFAVLPLFR